MPGLMCHTYANVSYSLQLTRTERLGTGSREGRLSYARRAYGVKNKMTHSVWKRRMSKGPSAASINLSQARTTPRHPATQREVWGQAATLLFARPPDPPAVSQKHPGNHHA
jgi:hypothetical protein